MNENYMSYIKNKLKGNFDVKYRIIKKEKGTLTLIFIDNLCDSHLISEYIAAPIVHTNKDIKDASILKEQVIEANIVGDVKNEEDAVLHILLGDVVIIGDFYKEVIFCEAKGYVRRSVSTPPTENVVKGPREGFTEAFVDNVSLIRRKVRNSDLKFETVFAGEKSNTVVVISYIKDVAPDKLVEYVKKVIKSYDSEFILDSNYIEEKIRTKSTAFDTVGYFEKPDIVASKLLEGRVAVIVEGTPFVMTVPYFFLENFQMPDDYYLNKYLSNITRCLRWAAFGMAILLPGLYIAITTYHFSLIPQVFVFRLASSRAGVPFPTVIEVILMLFFFQVLREAGIRLPQPIGQAMSIVGALILGDAAVGAGLASQTTIIIVALSSIASFLVPKLYGAITVWQLVIIVFSSLLGLPGFYVGAITMVAHIGGLHSSGFPYLYPLATYREMCYKDTVARDYLEDISNTMFDKDENK